MPDLAPPACAVQHTVYACCSDLLCAVCSLHCATNATLNAGLYGAFVSADLIQAQVLTFSPSELLRLLQLHQQAHMRPSKACIKYMAAVLEQHFAHQCAALLQQRSGTSNGGSSSGTDSGADGKAALQLVMCVCGLSVWGVRLHLRSVAELLLLLEGHKQQLPLSVVLQVSIGCLALVTYR